MFSWGKYLGQPFKLAKGWFGRREKGVTLIETLVALAILGIVAVAFLGGLATATNATAIAKEQATAQSLVISEIEYVKNYPYQYSASEYPVDPALDIPVGWSVPPPVVGLVHATDDGIQKVTVKAEYSGNEVLSMVTYKVNR